MKKNFLKPLWDEALRQVFNISAPREGEYYFTYYANQKKELFGLTKDEVESVFRYGYEQQPGFLIKEYKDCFISLKFEPDIEKIKITNCWKFRKLKKWW